MIWLVRQNNNQEQMKEKRITGKKDKKDDAWKDNRIGEDGGQFLGEVLKTNSTLTSLDLRSIEEVIQKRRILTFF